ncbi:MAG: TadE/TadG family type IV pilus assembly protein [Hyphomonadaceae bacterium]
MEFALVTPLMLFLLFGAVELTNALNTVRRVENVAASLADVVSRDTMVTQADLEDLWHAATPLMYPDNASGVQVRITSIFVDEDGIARVVWSEGHNGMTGRTENSVISLPPAMRLPERGIILCEITYPYEPMLNLVFGNGGLHTMVDPESPNRGGFEIVKAAYRPARLVDPVPMED